MVSRMLRSDDSWIAGLTTSSETERRQVVAELRGLLHGALARAFGRQLSDSDLEDLTQESILRVHQRRDSFGYQSRFTTWATTIAVNCALSELRRRRYEHVSLDDATAHASASLAEEASRSEREVEREVVLLRQGITEALTDRQREATLAKLGGLPLMEIARRLGTSQGAIYKLLHDARRRLKEYLDAARLRHDALDHPPPGLP
jgi:RNA polymerase sigma-70 factor, ECF subfamily